VKARKANSGRVSLKVVVENVKFKFGEKGLERGVFGQWPTLRQGPKYLSVHQSCVKSQPKIKIAIDFVALLAFVG
jgi:hypothetical protein